jgi:Cu/Ag efflux protein CusF
MLARFLGTFVIALALTALSGATEATAGKGGKPLTLQGTVYSIDASGETVTLKSSDGTLTTLNITRSSKLRRNNKKATLTGLVLGDQAAAQYDASNNVRQLNTSGVGVTTLQGGVLGVSSGTGVVQLDRGSFGTNAHTRITRNGQVSTLGTLTAQDHVVAHVTGGGPSSHAATRSGENESEGEDDDTAVDIQVEGPEECEIEGTITAIDVEAKTVTVSSEYGGWEAMVNVTLDTLIEIDGVEAPTIADLAVGQFVEVVYASDTQNAFRIEVENEEEEGYAEGPITAIDAVAGSITIDCYGSPVTVFVTASTKIEKDDEAAVFADLKVGDDVMAVYNTTTMIAKEIEVYSDEGEGEGGGGED